MSVALLCAISSCFAADKTPNPASQKPVVKNHEFDRVLTAEGDLEVVDGALHAKSCYLEDSVVDLCTPKHINAIKQAIKTRRPDFFKKYIIVHIPETHYGKDAASVLAVDSTTGIAYPLPFDFFVGSDIGTEAAMTVKSNLSYTISNNTICVRGTTHAGMAETTHLSYDDPCYKFALHSTNGLPGFVYSGEIGDIENRDLQMDIEKQKR
ncbi:MAG TPA: hypothetical protein VIE65_00695 [Methylobacter sp.]